MDIYELVNKYIEAGYSEEDAIPKVAQDIILLKIGNSKYHKNITVKGGVVMHNISKDMRRATRDMDIDFILEEGARELGCELNRWYMLKRSGKLVEWVKKHNPDISLIQDYHIYRPLPQDALYEVSNLDQFVQNKGYK